MGLTAASIIAISIAAIATVTIVSIRVNAFCFFNTGNTIHSFEEVGQYLTS